MPPYTAPNLKEHQPSLDIEGQISNLKSNGLNIEEEEYARNFLNDVSYFRLIKAYSLGLKPKNSKYYSNITFNQIVELYLFNCNFRQILFPIIEQIEVNLRCRVANYFSSKYGCLGYEDFSNFNFKDTSDYDFFIEEIQSEIKRNSKSPFVTNFKHNYCDGKLPFYALIEIMSFGKLSKFFKNLKSEDKKEIAKTYRIGYTYLESWIESIAYVRNVCAHYERLYNSTIVKAPMLYKEYSQISNNKIYGVLLCMKHIFLNDKKDAWIQFCDTLELYIEKYPHVKIKYMGFPEQDWKALLTEIKSD